MTTERSAFARNLDQTTLEALKSLDGIASTYQVRRAVAEYFTHTIDGWEPSEEDVRDSLCQLNDVWKVKRFLDDRRREYWAPASLVVGRRENRK